MKSILGKTRFPGAVWGCILSVIAMVGILLGGCGRESITKQESTGIAMGTVCTQTLYVQSAKAGSGEESPAFTQMVQQLLDDTEEELSWRLEESEIYKVNESAGDPAGYELPEHLSRDLHTLWQVSADSGGSLDLTIGPVVRLWNIDAWAAGMAEQDSSPVLPAEAEILTALRRTGFGQITFEGSTIYLPRQFALDLGAVGKGMACDRLLALLEQTKEIQAAVVSLGGNVLTYGSKPDSSAWKVGVVDPLESDRYMGVLELTGTWFVTTSGDYERYVEIDGKRYHHIMDPATGYPADSGIRSVTILSKSGMIGDALSTACFVLGPEKALALAEKYDVQILIVKADGETLLSNGMAAVYRPNR